MNVTAFDDDGMADGNSSSLKKPLADENRAALPQIASPSTSVTSPDDFVSVRPFAELSAPGLASSSNVQCAAGSGRSDSAATAAAGLRAYSAAVSAADHA